MAEMRQDLKLLFFRDLEAGHRQAREALESLRNYSADVKALESLEQFFHRVAGNSHAVKLPVLGYLASTCERAIRQLLDGVMAVPDAAVQQIADGLAGVQAVLDGRKLAPKEPAVVIPDAPPAALPVPVAGSAERRARSTVAIVDDDRFSAGLIDSCLRASGFDSFLCNEPSEALEAILARTPDLIILDVMMPKMDGFELCRRIRAQPSLYFVPVIFVTRKGDVEQRVKGLEAGGNDYVSKPFDPGELVARVRSHVQRLAELRDMAIRDSLTRCFNHKYFTTRLEHEVERARRYREDLCLAMLDVDHFKDVNDAFGHPAGDAVLSHLSNLIVASVRTTDMVARYGGEEFAILLVESQAKEAEIITNRIRERVAKHTFPLPSRPNAAEVPVTVSIGVAQLDGSDNMEHFIQRADQALYEAKRGGRNQVKVWAGVAS